MEMEWEWNEDGNRKFVKELIEIKEKGTECRVRFQAKENVAEVGVF